MNQRCRRGGKVDAAAAASLSAGEARPGGAPEQGAERRGDSVRRRLCVPPPTSHQPPTPPPNPPSPPSPPPRRGTTLSPPSPPDPPHPALLHLCYESQPETPPRDSSQVQNGGLGVDRMNYIKRKKKNDSFKKKRLKKRMVNVSHPLFPRKRIKKKKKTKTNVFAPFQMRRKEKNRQAAVGIGFM